MGTISAANATFFLSVNSIFPAPVQLQGFAADDVFDMPALRVGETLMGVDGRLSAGFVFVPAEMGITLQADSPSMFIFDQWYAQEQIARDKFAAQGVVLLTTLGTKWSLTNGFLSLYTPMPDAKRILQPRKFSITWERVSPASSV